MDHFRVERPGRRRIRPGPEIIGGCIAMEPDGRFTETIALRNEEAARDGESKEMPANMRKAWEASKV